jgi:class 3 adenylate cyclase/tetratricopeptide (TPR) repeat protein
MAHKNHMEQVTSEYLQAAREAARRFAWREVVDLLEQAVAGGEEVTADDFALWGEAAWWVGSLDDSISVRERAFATYQANGENRPAAIVAIALAKDHFAKGSGPVGTAWMQRAERLLEDVDECVEHGWMARMRSVFALEGLKDAAAALDHAERAYEIAQRFGDRDLFAVALHDRGRALVETGKVDEGWSLMDEATVGAVSGELSPFWTAAIYCNTIMACKHLADFKRARDWSDAAKRWCERQSIAGFPGMCRVYRARVMFVGGMWPEAEREVRAAAEELRDFNREYLAEALYELGEIRMHLGDDVAAEEAFKQAHELGREPQPGLALLRLRQGHIQSALSCIERGLDEQVTQLERATLLPAKVAILLLADRHSEATAAAEELTATADKFGTLALRAAAATARGLVARASTDVSTARRELRLGRKLWEEAGAPYEAARARLALATVYEMAGDLEASRMEAQAALATFDRLGAISDVPAAAEVVGVETAAPTVIRGSRTFMFTDIVRSTDLVEAIGDDAWSDLVRWHDQTLRSLFAKHSGEEVDHAGDGFFVAFADPNSAVECAVAIQRRLKEHRREHGFAPQVRIGLHATEALRTGGGYKGKGVHEAARLGALAQGGEIVVSRETLGEVPRHRLSESREVNLKGVSKPIEIVTINWN